MRLLARAASSSSRRAQAGGVLLALAVTACSLASPCAAQPLRNADGNPQRGAALIRQNGCGACHEIPGIEDADGLVGPPLDRIASRIYIAGVLRNTPASMVAWLQHPQAIVPGNAMPDMGLSDRDARDIAAYLDTLR